jgi:hypothetical protein
MKPHGRWLSIVGAILAALCCHAPSALAQAKDDPLIGRWQLDRARSEFSGNVPEKRITIFELLPDGNLKHITETVIANGSTDRVEYTSKYDGKDVPISNSFLWTVSVKRIDARKTERSGKVKGEVVETSTRTVSPDGQQHPGVYARERRQVGGAQSVPRARHGPCVARSRARSSCC